MDDLDRSLQKATVALLRRKEAKMDEEAKMEPPEMELPPLEAYEQDVCAAPYCLLTKSDPPKLQQPSIASKIIAQHYPTLAYDRVSKRLMEYQGTHWSALQDDDAFRLLVQAIETGADGKGFATNYVNGLRDMLIARLPVVAMDTDQALLPFQNGILDLGTMKFHDHDMKFRNTWCLPFDYDLTATYRPVIEWLTWAVNGDDLQVELLRAYLRATLTSAAYLQRYLELVGPGGTGKGTFTDLCQAIVGAGNYHATRLKTLHDSRFETARLYGKRLLVISDEDRFTDGASTLKRITGGDDLPFEEKNKQGGDSFKFRGMVLVTANEAVTTGDFTSGLQRRRITVRFDRQPAAEDRRDLIEEFKPCLPGVVAWALAMPEKRMKELLVATDKHVPSLGRISLETLRQVNPLAAWADDCLILDAKAETQVGCKKRENHSEGNGLGKTISAQVIVNTDCWLYASYCQWVADNGAKEIASRRFTDLLKDLLCHQLKLPVIHKERVSGNLEKPSRFCGVRIRHESDNGIPSFLIGKERKQTANKRQINGIATANMEEETAKTANLEKFCQEKNTAQNDAQNFSVAENAVFAVGAVFAVETQAESSTSQEFCRLNGADFAVVCRLPKADDVPPDLPEDYIAQLEQEATARANREPVEPLDLPLLDEYDQMPQGRDYGWKARPCRHGRRG